MYYVNRYMYHSGDKLARKNVEAMQFHVPEGARQKIAEFSEGRGFKVYADYLRELIESDMRKHGVELDLDVQRGRYTRDPIVRLANRLRDRADYARIRRDLLIAGNNDVDYSDNLLQQLDGEAEGYDKAAGQIDHARRIKHGVYSTQAIMAGYAEDILAGKLLPFNSRDDGYYQGYGTAFKQAAEELAEILANLPDDG